MCLGKIDHKYYLKIFFKPLPQWIWYLMESDKFTDSEHLSVIPGCSRV